MINITLKDGSKMKVEKGTSIIEIAKKISEGLARVATCGEINGEIKDLRYEIQEECSLTIHTFSEDDIEGKKAYWHTTSHIMAQAVKRLFPDVKFAIGPSINEGFYYDFDVERPFTDEDKQKIEEEMKKIIKEDLIIERFSLPKKEALELMKDRKNKFDENAKKDIHERNETHMRDAYKAACDVAKDYNWFEIKCMKDNELRTIDDIHEEIYNEVKKHI